MTAADIAAIPGAPARRADLARWRRRSRTIRVLRFVLPSLIVLIFAGLVGSVVWSTVRGGPVAAQDTDAPIRLVNPRFMGQDDKGRSFVLTASAAIRDKVDYQKVNLEKPALILDEGGPDQLRIWSTSGVYHEGDRKLNLEGGVHLSGPQAAFETAASLFDTKTGELVGSGPVQGSGPFGEIAAKSYGVFGKGDRMVFKGGVRARIDNK